MGSQLVILDNQEIELTAQDGWLHARWTMNIKDKDGNSSNLLYHKAYLYVEEGNEDANVAGESRVLLISESSDNFSDGHIIEASVEANLAEGETKHFVFEARLTDKLDEGNSNPSNVTRKHIVIGKTVKVPTHSSEIVLRTKAIAERTDYFISGGTSVFKTFAGCIRVRDAGGNIVVDSDLIQVEVEHEGDTKGFLQNGILQKATSEDIEGTYTGTPKSLGTKENVNQFMYVSWVFTLPSAYPNTKSIFSRFTLTLTETAINQGYYIDRYRCADRNLGELVSINCEKIESLESLLCPIVYDDDHDFDNSNLGYVENEVEADDAYNLGISGRGEINDGIGITDDTFKGCPQVVNGIGMFAYTDCVNIDEVFCLHYLVNLTSVSNLFQNSINVRILKSTFSSNVNLMYASRVCDSATILRVDPYLFENKPVISIARFFRKSKGLTELPAYIFKDMKSLINVRYMLVESCIEKVGDGLLNDCTSLIEVDTIFYKAQEITSIGKYIFAGTAVTKLEGTFSYDVMLSNNQFEVDPYLLHGMSNLEEMYRTFYKAKLKTMPLILLQLCTCTSMVEVFRECEMDNTYVPYNLLYGSDNIKVFDGVFWGTKIETLQKSSTETEFPFSTGLKKATSFRNVFRDTPLTEIPEDFFKPTTKLQDVSNAFRNTKLTSIPDGIFDSCPDIVYLDYTFAECYKLESMPTTILQPLPELVSARGFVGTIIRDQAPSTVTDFEYYYNLYYRGVNNYGGHFSELYIIVPSDFFAKNSKLTDISEFFAGADNIAVTELDFSNNKLLTKMDRTFLYTNHVPITCIKNANVLKSASGIFAGSKWFDNYEDVDLTIVLPVTVEDASYSLCCIRESGYEYTPDVFIKNKALKNVEGALMSGRYYAERTITIPFLDKAPNLENINYLFFNTEFDTSSGEFVAVNVYNQVSDQLKNGVLIFGSNSTAKVNVTGIPLIWYSTVGIDTELDTSVSKCTITGTISIISTISSILNCTLQIYWYLNDATLVDKATIEYTELKTGQTFKVSSTLQGEAKINDRVTVRIVVRTTGLMDLCNIEVSGVIADNDDPGDSGIELGMSLVATQYSAVLNGDIQLDPNISDIENSTLKIDWYLQEVSAETLKHTDTTYYHNVESGQTFSIEHSTEVFNVGDIIYASATLSEDTADSLSRSLEASPSIVETLATKTVCATVKEVDLFYERTDDPMECVGNGAWLQLTSQIGNNECIAVFSPMVEDENGVIQKLTDEQVEKLKVSLKDNIKMKFYYSDTELDGSNPDVDWVKDEDYEISIDNPEIGRTLYPEQEFCIYIKYKGNAVPNAITNVIFDLKTDNLPINIEQLNYSIVGYKLNNIHGLKGDMSFHFLTTPMLHKEDHFPKTTDSVTADQQEIVRGVGLELGTGTLHHSDIYMHTGTFKRVTHSKMMGVLAFTDINTYVSVALFEIDGGRTLSNKTVTNLVTQEVLEVTCLYACTFLGSTVSSNMSKIPTILTGFNFNSSLSDYGLFAFSDISSIVELDSVYSEKCINSYYKYAGCKLSSYTNSLLPFYNITNLKRCEYAFYKASVSSVIVDTPIGQCPNVISLRGMFKNASIPYYQFSTPLTGLEDASEYFMNSKSTAIQNNVKFKTWLEGTKSKLKDISYMFYGCNLTAYGLNGTSTSKTLVTNLEKVVSRYSTNIKATEMFGKAKLNITYASGGIIYYNPYNFYNNNKASISGSPDPHVFKNLILLEGQSLSDVPSSWK